MKKRLASLCTLIMATLMVLSACGSSATEASSSEAASPPEASTQVSEQPDASAGKPEQTDEEKWFGKYEEPVTLKLAVPMNAATVFGKGDSYANNVWTRGWESELNVKTEVMWEATDADNSYETKLNLAIASKDLPDIIDFATYAQFTQVFKAGLLEDLTVYYDEYAYPRLKTNIEADGGLALSWGSVGGAANGHSQRGRQ